MYPGQEKTEEGAAHFYKTLGFLHRTLLKFALIFTFDSRPNLSTSCVHPNLSIRPTTLRLMHR